MEIQALLAYGESCPGVFINGGIVPQSHVVRGLGLNIPLEQDRMGRAGSGPAQGAVVGKAPRPRGFIVFGDAQHGAGRPYHADIEPVLLAGREGAGALRPAVEGDNPPDQAQLAGMLPGRVLRGLHPLAGCQAEESNRQGDNHV